MGRSWIDAIVLALRGIWWRRGIALVVLVVATFVIAAAAGGPIYLRAAQESVLQDELRSWPAVASGLQVERVQAAGPRMVAGLSATVARAAEGLPAHRPQIGGVEMDGLVLDERDSLVATGKLVHREGVCDQIRLDRGRCPVAAGEAIVSAPTTLVVERGVGQRLRIRPFQFTRPGGGSVDEVAVQTLRVVGVYVPRDPDGLYWHSRGYVASQPYQPSEGTRIDAVFTPAATFEQLPDGTFARVVVDLALDPARVRLAGLPALREGADRVRRRLDERAPGAHVTTFLGNVLSAAAINRRALTVPVVFVIAQLLGLGWFVLYMMTANASAARSGEVALAKLRGFPPGAVLAFGLLEVLLLLVAAVPLGVLAGRAGIGVVSAAQLLPGTPVAIPPGALAGAGVAFVGVVGAALLSGAQALRRSVPELARRATAGRPGRHQLLGEAVTLVAAAAGLTALLMGGALGHGGQSDFRATALLVPGLVTLMAALVGARLLAAACRAAYRPTRASPHLGVFLAVRQVARRPAGLRLVVVLATAVGLASFAVAGWSVFGRNRHDRAVAELGAARVLTVRAPDQAGLRRQVREADPGGRLAMAVAAGVAPNADVELVGVDTGRLAGVGFWRPDLADRPLAALMAELRAPTVAELRAPAGAALPAIVGADALAKARAAGRPLRGPGLDGHPIDLRPVAVVAAVPGTGPYGAWVDLDRLERHATGRRLYPRSEVWLAEGAPDGLVDRLRAAGLAVEGERRASQREELFGRQPPSLGMLLFLTGAGVAALLAAGGTLLDLYLLGRRRAFELAAMGAIGVRRRTLAAGVLVEQAMVLGAGMVFGVVAGLLAARLVLPAVPLYNDRPVFPPVLLEPDPRPLGLLVAVMAVAVGAGIGLATALLMRSAVPDRLREGQA
jgi:putative ABC transport system permease protein